MPTLSKSLRGQPKAAILAKRDKFVDDLDDIYNKLLDTPDEYIDPESYENFKISCNHLYLYRGDDGREQANFERYFSPMSVNELQSYPINEDDKDTMEDLQLEQTLWKEHRSLDDRRLDDARKLCRIVCRRFRFSRKFNDNETCLLWMRTGWIPSDFSKCILHEIFEDELFHSLKWHPNDAWRARFALSKPHVMFTLIHEYPSDDNKLLRGEVLAILATILTRLTSNEYQDHTVIPVQVLSFMGDKQAQLLQAYFGDKGLIIYKSHLLSFQDPEAAEKSMEFLLQFMAGKLVGSTAVTNFYF
ncbi:hypothetical protein IFM58399_06781 [Aspergillus lentulus]|uniref:Uncharacterized protein n=1 Tax=Aspergillus lentulus TaxID=293939 RepID=A0AAN5YRS6_ASPLE|nr:uncharacterized protein IFM58399_06781 [Aspergillus lentulus]KAF4158114.1 hypothetical protein CNMCM6069_004533 [Aspergillus lentulus]KAF4176030.1 hypothetical protein CNMCM7927_004444 [Aspergillus lentulus]KAF4176381.1 hypothetical protein CNMCM8060_006370 [Aspergillus lentulus]KAF4194565.1 hypothetical protein CNMCM8694_007373 [Aspergillus lentulus]KAF4206829.1 hypothetical protein CNMCM8927_004396 [Aspergillus lentulus]